jgi:amidase
VVDRLVKAGMIILGKANLTEASGMKSPDMLPGWSVTGGQTQSPYVAESNIPGEPIIGNSRPGGSSAGSAVAVAAGFAPLSLGTEAVGSVITPGNRAALYALKVAPGGEVSGDGVFGISTTFDGIGPIATTSADLAALTAVLFGRQLNTKLSDASNLSVGFVDPKKWKLPEGACNSSASDEEQMVSHLLEQ